MVNSDENKVYSNRYTDYFGFLKSKEPLQFYMGAIYPVDDIEEVIKEIESYTNQDGFLYPPFRRSVIKSADGKTRRVPSNDRPEDLYRVPASHKLHLDISGTQKENRMGPGAFIIHLLGYLFGTRLQFGDGWFDGRIPIKPTHDFTIPPKDIIEHFMSHCYEEWKNWKPEQQKLITNLLYMHSRSPCYERDWERFTFEYMVTDGCYSLARMIYKERFRKQKQRRINKKQNARKDIKIHSLCDLFGMKKNDDYINTISKLRNDLFHQSLWDDAMLGSPGSVGFMMFYRLHDLNQRILAALFKYNNNYIKTPWWNLEGKIFDMPKS